MSELGKAQWMELDCDHHDPAIEQGRRDESQCVAEADPCPQACPAEDDRVGPSPAPHQDPDPILRYYDVVPAESRSRSGDPIPRPKIEELARAAGLLTQEMWEEALQNWVGMDVMCVDADDGSVRFAPEHILELQGMGDPHEAHWAPGHPPIAV